jgi:hypothetical protein
MSDRRETPASQLASAAKDADDHMSSTSAPGSPSTSCAASPRLEPPQLPPDPAEPPPGPAPDPDELWRETYRAAVRTPGGGRVVEGARGSDRAIATGRSGGGVSDDLRRLLTLPVPNPELLQEPGACGMPHAVEALAAQNRGQLPNGPVAVTRGGFRFKRPEGSPPGTQKQCYYKAPCQSCNEIVELNPRLQHTNLPPGVPAGLQPGQEVPFTPPPDWNE